MRIYKYLAFLILSMSTFLNAFAEVEMADTLRSNGKIYVVVAVVLTILLGLIPYLVITDRKVSALEEEINATKNN